MGLKIEYETLTPFMYLDGELYMPVNIFSINKALNTGIWGSIKDLIPNKSEEKGQDDKTEKFLKYSLERSVKSHKVDFLFDILGVDSFSALYEIILWSSLKLFKQVYVMPRNTVLNIDQMAKRYSKTPIEIICNHKDSYNELDGFLFNFFISNESVLEDNKMIEKQNRQNRKNQQRRQ